VPGLSCRKETILISDETQLENFTQLKEICRQQEKALNIGICKTRVIVKNDLSNIFCYGLISLTHEEILQSILERD
jgi:hypothetical protein